MGGSENLFGILSLALALGLVHALDADHIVAVSALASGTHRSSRHPWRYCMRWAMGHGATLVLFGLFALLIGKTIPDSFGRLAEIAVGVVLVAIGIAVLYRLRKQRLSIGFHRHADAPSHAHWCQPEARPGGGSQQHAATLVGALHGVAGSAPLLALIPVASSSSAVFGLFYLLLFCIGVLLSMLLCGGVLGVIFKRLRRLGESMLYRVRCAIAAASIAAGGYLIQSVL